MASSELLPLDKSQLVGFPRTLALVTPDSRRQRPKRLFLRNILRGGELLGLLILPNRRLVT